MLTVLVSLILALGGNPQPGLIDLSLTVPESVQEGDILTAQIHAWSLDENGSSWAVGGFALTWNKDVLALTGNVTTCGTPWHVFAAAFMPGNDCWNDDLDDGDALVTVWGQPGEVQYTMNVPGLLVSVEFVAIGTGTTALLISDEVRICESDNQFPQTTAIVTNGWAGGVDVSSAYSWAFNSRSVSANSLNSRCCACLS